MSLSTRFILSMTKTACRDRAASALFSSGAASSHSCPYAILGVPRNSDYATVKQAFLKAAMHHHPDRNSNEKSSADSHATFIRYRQAFEQIVQQNSSPDSLPSPDPNIEPYFREDQLTFEMDEDTRKEVIRAYETLSHGGKDKGGYWEMARQLAERESSRPAHVYRLKEGVVSLRRRRKK